MPDSRDQKLDTIARHPFRAKFHLRGRERATPEIPKVRELTREEHGYVVDVICCWIEREMAGAA